MDEHYLEVELSVKGQLLKKRVAVNFDGIEAATSDQDKRDIIEGEVDNALNQIVEDLILKAESVYLIPVQSTGAVEEPVAPATEE